MPEYPLNQQEDPDQRPGLRPPQFGVTTLLLLVAGFALFLAVLKSVGPMAAFALLLLILAVLAHVVGNALGTKLRDQDQLPTVRTDTVQSAEPHHFAPVTKLGLHQPVGWIMLALSLGGGVLGAWLGGSWLAKLNAEQLTTANLSLAVGSCGVLGSLAGFTVFSFAKVVIEAIWQAHQEDSKP